MALGKPYDVLLKHMLCNIIKYIVSHIYHIVKPLIEFDLCRIVMQKFAIPQILSTSG